MMKTRFKCVRCGKITVGRRPKGGDGTFYYPSRHERDGKLCEGVWREAEWVLAGPQRGRRSC